MDLKYEAIYRMICLGKFTLVDSASNVTFLPNIIRHLIHLRVSVESIPQQWLVLIYHVLDVRTLQLKLPQPSKDASLQRQTVKKWRTGYQMAGIDCPVLLEQRDPKKIIKGEQMELLVQEVIHWRTLWQSLDMDTEWKEQSLLHLLFWAFHSTL